MIVPGDREIPPGDVTWTDDFEPFVETFDRGFVGEERHIFATGGLCLPMMPIYDLGSLLISVPRDGWPHRFHLFPRIDRATRDLREARWRARRAWTIIRHGAEDYYDDA